MSKLDQTTHKRFIDEYTVEYAIYKRYAAVLKACLETACSVALPEALVQARPKSIASFAEKCVRKQDKYKDPVRDMTDLCGARVIVQTLKQVNAVRQFIEANFKIEERDDKTESLGATEFGYRDMHYIVRIRTGEPPPGFSDEDVAAIGCRRAEVQVRTWVQHAWADTLHDRMYKTKLKYPAEFKRIGALLAAIMEDGDRSFDRLAEDIDGMLANYSAFAAPDDVRKEIEVQRLILANAPAHKRPGIALSLARLLVATGDYAGAVAELEPHAATAGSLQDEIELELGHARCRNHAAAPRSDDFRRGQADLQGVVDRLAKPTRSHVPNLRKQRSLHARALARLAWSHSLQPGGAPTARKLYQAALALEPANPYFLAEVVGHEIHWQGGPEQAALLAPQIRSAIGTCREHLENGTEMPYACFTAGRLCLLLGEPYDALCLYARGIRHFLSGASAMLADVLAAEEQWLLLVCGAHEPAEGYRWCLDLLLLARRVGSAENPAGASPVIIVAGGAGTLGGAESALVQNLLSGALPGLNGLVISGGTRAGTPGAVGAAAEASDQRGGRTFRTRGYLPALLSEHEPRDERYDELITCGEHGFTPEQPLRYWRDLFDAGTSPASVRLFGFGGGRISGCEYAVALALGSTVGLVAGSRGRADRMLADPAWRGEANLIPLPCDPATVRAFLQPHRSDIPEEAIEGMARNFHETYVAGSANRLPDNMKPWPRLPETYKTANREQARCVIRILEACGFVVRPAGANPSAINFTEEEVERMAELEHGRWNVERLRDGWRPGPRDDANKRHPCIVPWSDRKTLTEAIKDYDRNAVRQFPAQLARVGLDVVRP
ncbi:MAG TPA: RyR domain-containing protein [Kiritimatiellia bacterium]|nr:RyR domain-containing protein [Kiritimatiellia bacterium]